MRCAVVIPVGPGHAALAEESAASVTRAASRSTGVFDAVEVITVDDSEARLGRSRARNAGVELADSRGAEWVFFLDADDVMDPGAFGAAAPWLDGHDAVFGLICELGRSGRAVARRGQIASFSTLGGLLAFDPFLTLQMGHFVRTSVARRVSFDERLDCGEDFDYYLRLWSSARCVKIPSPLFLNRRGHHSQGPRSTSGHEWRSGVKRQLRDFCRDNGIIASFEHRGRSVRTTITNPSDLIQREHLLGRFFETAELEYLRPRVAPGSVIADVGANLGNHAIYFDAFMQPSRVVVIEPNPASIELLNRNVALNACATVDASRLGVGAGARTDYLRLVDDQPDNLGAARLVPDSSGSIELRPLDELLPGRVDLVKMDVEWMELEVLRGAQRILRDERPQLFVEVMRKNLSEFLSLMDSARYRVCRSFEYVHAVNLHLVPTDAAA